MAYADDDVPKMTGGGRFPNYWNRFIRPYLKATRVRCTRHFRRTPEGLVFVGSPSVTESAAVSTHPFKIHTFKDGNTFKFWIYPGTCWGKLPTQGGVALSEVVQPSTALTLNTVTDVYLQLNVDDSSALTGVVDSVVVYTAPATSPPTDTSSVKYKHLGKVEWSDDRPTATSYWRRSLDGQRYGGPGGEYMIWGL